MQDTRRGESSYSTTESEGEMLGTLCLAIVGMFLVVAGVSKMKDLSAHGRVVMGYKVMPDSVAYKIGVILPFVETALGILLIFSVAKTWTAIAAGMLFAIYALGLVINIARGRTELDCGCFGFTSEKAPTIGWFHVLRAVALSALSFVALFFAPTESIAESVLAILGAALIGVIATALVAIKNIISPNSARVDSYLEPVQRELQKIATVTPLKVEG